VGFNDSQGGNSVTLPNQGYEELMRREEGGSRILKRKKREMVIRTTLLDKRKHGVAVG